MAAESVPWLSIGIIAACGGAVIAMFGIVVASMFAGVEDAHRATSLRLFGRQIRMVTLSVTAATAIVTWTMWPKARPPRPGDLIAIDFPWPSTLFLLLGVASTVSLVGGWVAKSNAWQRLGLLLSAGMWTGRGVWLGLEFGWSNPSSALSWCWASIAASLHWYSVLHDRPGGGRE